MRCKKCDGTGGDHMSDEGGKGYCSACRGTGEVQGRDSGKSEVAAVAKQFCRLLLKKIGPKGVSESVRLNRAEESPSVCHTHDFCDANMVMDAAMRACKADADDTDLWNSAWSMAKAAEFDPEDISVKSQGRDPVAGDIITLKGEHGTYVVIEWNGDRGFVSPTEWPYTIVPQELVSASDIKSIVRSRGKNPRCPRRRRARNTELTGPYIAEGPYVLTLEAWGNPDHRQDPDQLVAPRKKVTVHALNEGAKIVEDYIDQNQLGGGNWGGRAGQLFTKDGGAYVGRYSYNTRFWPWDNTDGHGLPFDMGIPEGLSKLGVKAFWIIFAILARTGLVFTGGCRAFRGPGEWHSSGHGSGKGSELVIVHDGGDLGIVFGQMSVAEYGEIQEALRKHGMFVEGINAAVSAVYKE
jgi:hypothetical protein